MVLNYTNRTADVFPYDKSYDPITNVPIVSGATAWNDPVDHTTYILVFHESLYYGEKMDHSLMNPNQIRHSGLHFWDNPFDPLRDLCIEIDYGPKIPLDMDGTKIGFISRAPTDEELHSCIHIDMTSVHPWNPTAVSLGEVNTAPPSLNLTRSIGQVNSNYHPMSNDMDTVYEYNSQFSSDSVLHSIEPSLVEFKERMIQAVTIDPDSTDVPARRTFISHERHNKLCADKLADLWGVGPSKAAATIKVTTQRGIRSAILPISRRYRTDRMYNVKRLNSRFATDTLWADHKSLNQHKYAQIYTHKNGFAAAYPLDDASGKSIGFSLKDFISDFGAPEHLTFDGASAQVGRNTLFMQTLRQHSIKYHVSSPRRPNENPAEGSIREIKKRWYRIMMKKKVPPRLWDYGIVWTCETANLTVSSSRYADGRTPLEIITGETPDISEYLDFGFYDWARYTTNAGLGETSLGRWLGVSHKVGQLMSYWILLVSGHVTSCTTVQRLTNAEMETREWQQRMNEYDDKLNERLNDKQFQITYSDDVPAWNRLSLDDIDDEFITEFNKVINDESIKDADDYEDKYSADTMDAYLNMELGLPRGPDGELQHAIVKRRRVGINGNPVGVANNNPLLDSREYEVEHHDGTIEVQSANIIAENLFAQVDEEGHRQLLMYEITDHRCTNDAIPKEKGFETTANGNKRKIMTTKGWELLVSWKDGSTNWVTLKDLKNSYPIELAEYAIKNKLQDEPAFSWWVPYTLKKRKAIISKVKSKYWQRTHRYGLRMPKSVDEALEIDKENGDNLWRDAIDAEMKKVRVAFDKYDKDPTTLIGYKEITTHMIFEIKLSENFRRKARLVADGHKTDTPSSVTYSSVVSRDSVRICLLTAALNDLELQSADIENAYITAPCREKFWTRAGAEFGSDEGSVMIISRALYGLKSSGAAFRAFLAQRLDEIGFKSSIADPDVWLRPATKPDGENYYEYILVYVDDVLCISHDAVRAMKQIAEQFKFKKDEIKPPDVYLGASLAEKDLNGKKVWTMSSTKYVNAAIETIREQLEKRKLKFYAKADTPMSYNYIPELDNTPELSSDDVTLYQEMIGILRWATEIGRVDILTEVSILSSYQASPRQGHLEQIIHIFSYLKKKPKITLYFDPIPPRLDESMFTGTPVDAFREQYRDAKEELPPRMPEPRGRMVTTTAFVDASHASDKATRRSHTGYIIFVNRAPIIWFSKKQSTVESSTFSSEFIAMKTCTEAITALRYKLRMFGIPIDGPTSVLCDNQSVVNNSSKIESILNKKHNSIAYHATRWATAAEVIRVGKIGTEENLADAMTKRLAAMRRNYLFGNWTY